MSKSIAIVEDEATLLANYRDIFERHGFRVATYADRAGAVAAFEQRLPDMVIIDIGLGDEPEGGFDLCRTLRAASAELPLIFLTARDSEIDEISGLRLGADDYLTKDISEVHLMARVNGLFRRIESLRQAPAADDVHVVGEVAINGDRMSVTWAERPVDLSVTEFWIVACLARRPGHLKTRQQLMDAANIVVDESTVTSHIKRIRRKLKDVDPAADPIQTEYGIGYRWRTGGE
ncbi:MAG: proteobacterial dedicated sortase system response regulator [Gammaproteobacteria bacterium]